ncbi:MAG TPA: prepilin-type N-terminal cleavage/methylation domain-containing protein [Aquabacterium sp.]|nr:prepilin-type N-terminal cleavage/methylation domain-containing protein [Aquabacterium sp.]
MAAERRRGFTLIELMMTVAVVTLLAAVALPSYNAYVTRSRVPVGLEALSSHAMRMEQGFQDTGNYGTAGCRLAVPAAANFNLACSLTGNGAGFTTTATGSGPMAGYTYSIDQNGTRRTVAHPKGVPPSDCWSIKGATCDS